jgi:hypothetical protein
VTDFADVDDVNGRLLERDLTDAERIKVPALISDASALMLERFPYLASTVPATAKGVCCGMVLRVVNNPRGLRQESIDDYSYTVDSARSAGQLYLTPEDVAALTPPGANVFSIVPMVPPPEPAP